MRLVIVAAVLFVIIIGSVIGIIVKMNAAGIPSDAVFFAGQPERNLDLNSPDNTLLLDLKSGRVTIRMRPDLAPMHVARIKELVRQGFYDGLPFHRVMEGFMAQTGDPKGDGTGGSGMLLMSEFSPTKFVRGVVGMARSQNVDSADSQFFIMLGDGAWLNTKYTVWGEVTDGMEFVGDIKLGDKDNNGMVDGAPDRIVKMSLASDAK